MQITIDNEDGRGAVDYTAAVSTQGPITLHRALNAPTRCTAEFVIGLEGLPFPARRGRIVVKDCNATTLFTGYLATEPVPAYMGIGTTGPVYKARINALSDEWLLDKQGSGANALTDGLTLGVNGSNLVSQRTQTAQANAGVGGTGITVTTAGNPRAVGAFAVQPAAGWSTNAAAAANASYATYRVLDGSISVASAGSTTHTLNEADGSLNLAALSTAHVRELANDITVSGTEEPAAYVQEIFQGDGTTTDFVLADAAYRGMNRILLRDSFDAATVDTTQWTLTDGANHLQLTGAGLTMNGGNGFDGQTTLTANSAIEMAGALVTEFTGVTFAPASDGMLAGFYNGGVAIGSCLAGFRVRQSTSTSGGVTVLVPMLNGAEAGTTFTPASGHQYTLRLRLFCTEMQRVPQRFYCMVDGVVQEFGEISDVGAPMHAVFEIVDEGVTSNTPSTVLYDTAQSGIPLTNTPATCIFTAVDAVSLYGSIGSVEVSRPGSLWVVSTLPNGAFSTRLIGAVGEAVDCKVEYGTTGSVGKVSFFAGRVPQAGERVTVSYRKQRRSVARIADATSIEAETVAGTSGTVPGVSRWLGKVISPPARSSADCEAAAQAILAMSTARTAALAGRYLAVSPAQDIWPGDVLQITMGGTTYSLLVRAVTVEDNHSVPEVLRYQVVFANDWGTEWEDGLGLKLSGSVASDAVLPSAASAGPSAVLINLQQMAVVSLTGSAIQIDAGLIPPAGGGFEVRRRDWAFGVGVDAPDLVLQSPVRSFSVPRASQAEHFYIRMYDGSTPRQYSRFSSALFVNWPFAPE